MPILNHFALQQTPTGSVIGGQTLLEQGPITPVEVKITRELSSFLSTKGETLPPACTGLALIDTGTTRSCIDVSVAQRLNLLPISATQVVSANGQSFQGTYAAHIRFPAIGWDIEYSSVLSVNLSGQTIQGAPVIVLIGRDLLAKCVFVYNGTIGSFVLAH